MESALTLGRSWFALPWWIIWKSRYYAIMLPGVGNHKFDFCWVLLTCKASQLGSCSQALRKGKERKKYVTRLLKIDVLLALTEFSEGGELVVLLSHNSFNFMQETFVPSLFAKYFFSVKPSSHSSQRRPLLNVSTNDSFTMQTKGRFGT